MSALEVTGAVSIALLSLLGLICIGIIVAAFKDDE